MSSSYAYRVLDQAKVIRALEQAAHSPIGEKVVTEHQARVIKPQLEEVAREITTRVDRGEAPTTVVMDVVSKTTTKPRVAPGPPSNGRQFARIAIMKLEEIRDDYVEREQAFDEVQSYLDSHRGEAGRG